MERCFTGKLMTLALPFVILTACGGDDTPDTVPVPATPAPSTTQAPPTTTQAPPTTPAETPAAQAVPEAPQVPPATGPSPEMIALGQQVFSGPGVCTACHGPGGQGTALGPNLTDDEWIWIENPRENLQAKLVEQIRRGTPQPRNFPAPMPPMGGGSLSEEQLQAVAAYVGSL